MLCGSLPWDVGSGEIRDLWEEDVWRITGLIETWFSEGLSNVVMKALHPNVDTQVVCRL